MPATETVHPCSGAGEPESKTNTILLPPITYCSEVGTEKPLQIVKSFQGSLSFSAPFLIQYCIIHGVFKEPELTLKVALS